MLRNVAHYCSVESHLVSFYDGGRRIACVSMPVSLCRRLAYFTSRRGRRFAVFHHSCAEILRLLSVSLAILSANMLCSRTVLRPAHEASVCVGSSLVATG